jgi:hypothetical protein
MNQKESLIGRPVSNAKLRRPESEFARQRKQFDVNARYKYDNILSMELDGSEKTTQEFAGPGMKSRVDMILSMDSDGHDGQDDVAFLDGGSHGAPPISSPYLSYGMNAQDLTDDRSIRPSDRTSAGGNGEREKSSSSRPKTGKKRESSGGGAGGGGSGSAGAGKMERERDRESYSSSSAGAGSSSSMSSSSNRPKSASRRREEGGSSSRGGQEDYNSASNAANRYMQDEELYPSARGLVRK